MSAAIKLSSPATRGFWEIPVLFEDAHLLALDKPGGLSVSPDDGSLGQPALMRLLHDGIAAGKPWAGQRNLAYLDPAHRPDSDATGVLLLAKTKGVSHLTGQGVLGISCERGAEDLGECLRYPR